MDRQSSVTSSRKPSPMVSDILSGGKRMLFMSYGIPLSIHILLSRRRLATYSSNHPRSTSSQSFRQIQTLSRPGIEKISLGFTYRQRRQHEILSTCPTVYFQCHYVGDLWETSGNIGEPRFTGNISGVDEFFHGCGKECIHCRGISISRKNHS